jgi:hypothetical protein
MGETGCFKIPREQFEEIVAGKGALVDWLKEPAIQDALLFPEEADIDIVNHVTLEGYGDIDEKGVELVGRDPFLIGYGYVQNADRTVVTFELSAPSKKGANRKIPDVCAGLGVHCCDLFQVIRALKFSTTWRPPKPKK